MDNQNLDCVEVQAKLDAWLTGEVGRMEGVELEHHIAHCTPCSKSLAELQSMRKLIRQAQQSVPPEVNQTMGQVIDDLASKQLHRSLEFAPFKAGKGLWPITTSCVVITVGIFLSSGLSFAVRLATIGGLLNLCGLFYLPLFLKNYQEWSES